VQESARRGCPKARDGFIKALRDAHRWLDELLFDPTHTIESLAVREGKSERSIRMTGIRESRHGDLAASARAQGRILRVRSSLCSPRADDARGRRAQVRGAVGPGMERPLERVMILDDGYAWNGGVYHSLSQVAKAITGTNWNGHRFFGLKAGGLCHVRAFYLSTPLCTQGPR